MGKYVALLRGINVGGHQVLMTKLKKVMEGAGCGNVKTILASGNAAFESEENDSALLTRKLEATLAKAFGFPIPVLLRTMREIEKLIASEPFKEVKITPVTGLYVTFLSEKPASPGIPKTPAAGFQILKVTGTTVCSVVRASQGRETLDLMSALERHFGKTITTRNWNTIVKISQM